MRSKAAIALSVLMVLGFVAPALGGAAGATGVSESNESGSGFVSMSATVGSDQPVVGESFTVTANLSNSDRSNGAYQINRVVVRNGTGDEAEELASKNGALGAIAPGERAEQSVDVTLNESGTHTLMVAVSLESPAGFSQTVVQPVTVEVYDPHPRIEVEATSARPDEWRTLSVTLENGRTDAVRQVEVTVGGEDITYRTDRKASARVAAGSAATFDFSAKVPENGRRDVAVELAYTTADGERRTIAETITTSFSEQSQAGAHPSVSVETDQAVANAWRPVNVTVANGLSEEVRQVTVDLESDAVTFDTQRKVAASMAPGQARQFSFSGRADSGRHEVTVVLRYTTESGASRSVERTVVTDFTEPDNPGRIRLTGVTVRRGPGGVQISGSASNVGGDDVQSVLVEVDDEENVEPAQPQPEFFVGEVDASDFVSFDLNARLENNRTTVPIRVTYIVDGVEKSFVTEAEFQGSTRPRTQPANDGGGGGGFALVGLIVLVVALIGVLGVGYLGYRFVRG